MNTTISLDPEKQSLTEKQRNVLLFLQEYYKQSGFPPTMKEIGDRFGFASTNAVTQYLQALERKGYIRRLTKGASRGIQLLDIIDSTAPFLQASEQSGTTYNHGVNGTLNSTVRNTLSNSLSNTASVAQIPPLQPMFKTAMHGVKNIIIAGQAPASQPFAAFLSPRGQIKIDTDFFAPPLAEGETPPSQAEQQTLAAQLFAAIAEDDGMNAEGIRQGDVAVAQQQFTAEDGEMVVAIAYDAIIVRRLSLIGGVGELTASTRGFPPISLNASPPNAAIIGVLRGIIRKI
jgi:SOS-response transcriptional repressor LexA